MYGKNSLFQNRITPSIFELGEIQTHFRNPWDLSFPNNYGKEGYSLQEIHEIIILLKIPFLYVSFSKIGYFSDFSLIFASQKFYAKDTLPPTGSFESRGLKDSKTGFKFLLAQKLRELEQFEKVNFSHTKFHLVKFCMGKIHFFKIV